jgi:hypothetical protein
MKHIGGICVNESLREFDFGANDIGIFLMESITTGLYRNPMNVLREYISNEMDNSPPPTEIQVKVETERLVISGNGPGMDYGGIRDAVKVGFSPKNLTESIGFRGIGIYSGVSICNKIAVTTKRRENPNYYQIIINCEGLRQDIKERSSISLIDSLKGNVKWTEMTAPEGQAKFHGTAVEFVDILEDFNEILDEDQVAKYLEMTAPVEFDPNFPYREEVYNYLKDKLGTDFKATRIRVNNMVINRVPKYASLDRPVFGKIQKGRDILGFYWVCENSRTEKIDDQSSRGLVYREKGFTIGDRTTITKLFLNERNKHLIDHITGEVHIVSDKLIPNTERVEFEASPERDTLESLLVKDILRDISTMRRKKSAIKMAEERILKAKDLSNNPKFENYDMWLDEMTEAKKLSAHLSNDMRNKYITGGMKKKVERAHKRVESWIKKNQTPPRIDTVAEETEGEFYEGKEIAKEIEAEREEISEEKSVVEEKEQAISRPEQVLEAARERIFEAKPGVEEKVQVISPLEWLPSEVKEMCYRIGHSDWNDVIIGILEVLADDAMLRTNDEFRGFLQKLELKLALLE